MYYEHFGLDQAPFKITPNTDFFFSGGNRGPVLEALIYAITRGEGIVKVTGEVGSGKTMLCSMLQNRLPENVDSVYLANPSVAPEEVLHAIAFELQLGVRRGADHLEVMHALQDYLVKQHAAGKRVVVFIEESQSMPLATLEEIRLLSNLETRNDKLLQIVLFGQPELDEMLRRPDIRQLRDRIAHSFRLQPLNDEEVREYLTFRMRAAGYRGPEVFSGSVVKRIAQASSGLTRRVNLIADKALLAAFSENTHTIHRRHIDAALRDSEFGTASQPVRAAPPMAWAAAALVAGIAIGVGLYAAMDAGDPATDPARAASTAENAAASASPAARTAAATVPSNPPASATASAPTFSNAAASAAPAAAAAPAASAVSGSAQPAVAVAPAAEAPRPLLASAPASMATQLSAPGPAARDFIAERMQATDQWVRNASERTYSIQLFVIYDDEQLRNQLNVLPKFIEANDLFMYRSAAQGRPMVNVLWGTFLDRRSAQEELALLPADLRANRPYVRTLNGIRAEISRQRGAGRY